MVEVGPLISTVPVEIHEGTDEEGSSEVCLVLGSRMAIKFRIVPQDFGRVGEG